ncbi:hypothetical protein ACX1N5_12785 [Acinetobacter sp. ANC 4636]|uniref:hypothetical protein n=1 Tax=unclassified Acinetobacter TaxID=196816 RepID=UPI0002CDD1A4|nr:MULTISPECIES: hypothetical protein [unclassified Acinetobacter]ENU80790.1 hypothetical protein F975_01337 [Acinetobacter sp. ANC 3789]TCB30214.1 hypothetical protein E0H86_10660 [Acinetobacter sp. ANC 4635]
MSESQQTQEQPKLLLNFGMIALETFYSFIFTHDDVVQLHAKEFIEQQLTVKVNCYIPYVDFYVRFTRKGILFDLQAPDSPVDLEISGTVFSYVQTLVLGHKKSVRGIRMYGHDSLKDPFRDLLSQLALPKLASDWKKWLFRSEPDSEVVASKKRIAPLLEKIEYQRSKINSLQVEVKQYKNRLRHIEKKQRRLNSFFITVIVILLCTLLYNSWAG